MRNANILLHKCCDTHAVLRVMMTYDRPLKAMNGIILSTENKLRGRNKVHDRKKVRKQETKARKDIKSTYS